MLLPIATAMTSPFLRPFADAESAVTGALNIGRLVLAIAIGVVAGALVALVVSMAAKAAFHRSAVLSAALGRMRGPAYWALMAWGAWTGQSIALADTDLSQLANGRLVGVLKAVLLLAAILATTWVAFAACWIVEDAARLRHAADSGRARRYETQAQVLRRLTQAIIVILGVAWSVFVTFPGAKSALSALLASAGLISVVAGLAAQSTLGNLFAGIQLAFTDAIRVGDVVVIDQDGGSGAVEEITLTYVVIRAADERRLIVPSTFFTTKSFENWTRRAARQLGNVELVVDWLAPMAQIRARVEELLLATDLWDGRTWNVQMTGSDRDSVTVRVLVSARNSGDLWDLRCYLRENLIAWLADEEPWTRPVSRIQPQEIVTVEHDESRELVARLASELSGIAGSPGDTGAPGEEPRKPEEPEGASPSPTVDKGVPAARTAAPVDAVHAARLQAARRRAKRARRRAMADRQRASAEGSASASASSGTPAAADDDQRTRVFTPTEILDIAHRYAARPAGAPSSMSATTTGGRGERMFSGSPDAEERKTVYAGPGEDALAEREETARRRAEQEGPLADALPSPSPGPGPETGTAADGARETGKPSAEARGAGDDALDRTRTMPAVRLPGDSEGR